MPSSIRDPIRDRLEPGIEPASLKSPALAGGFFTTNATWDTHDNDSERLTNSLNGLKSRGMHQS